MSRMKKNIVMVGLLAILIALTCFNVNYVINSAYSSSSVLLQNTNPTGTENGPPEGEPPEGFDENGPPEGEPPTEQSGPPGATRPPDGASGPPEGSGPPDGTSGPPEGSGPPEEGEPPEGVSGPPESSNTETTTDEAPPENNETPNNGTETSQEQNSEEEKELSLIDLLPSISVYNYIVFGFQGLAIAVIMSYLLMSQFNKKTIKETFNSVVKKIAFVICTILLTAGILLIEASITYENIPKDNLATRVSNDSINSVTFQAVNEYRKDITISSGDYLSEKANENVFLAMGKIETVLENLNVKKNGDSKISDNLSYYGYNSAFLAKDKAKMTIKNTNINTDAYGANAIFSYGGTSAVGNTSSDGTNINIYDSNITTTDQQSAALMTSGGGLINAYNVTAITNGSASSTIRTDRGGGIINVEGGSFTANGNGSAVIYSTGEINIKNAKLESNQAEGIIIEGKHSVTLDNSNLTNTNAKTYGKATSKKNIIMFQSSGTPDSGDSTFSSTDSTITTNYGDTFYVTNTTATINLKNSTIINNDSTGNLLNVKSDAWGTPENNGGNAYFNLTNQNVAGIVAVDNQSTLIMKISSNSYYEGKINSDNTAKSVKLTLDKTSKIKLTGDTYIQKLNNKDTKNTNIDFNGYKLYVNGKAIN